MPMTKNISRIQKNIKAELKDKKEKPSQRVDIEKYIRYIQSGNYKHTR